ncbi:MAG: helix-turn-helix domain-containing protein [Sagittula sp.]|jgi:transcriptional regulator with XRE-family HTH domain|uniref:helix-turn-helix domain-containing protein n=2 Tax=Sagittula TaxID=58842 RepID=UPI0024C3847C|nr:helix-turn-helix domain-containing protein [Sagittula sp. MA-2]WHZ35676.1 helix-turn-helix domain-containing protein [Sagittula sp. MA-2]
MQDTDWYGPDVATLGDRLAAAREAQGMSQETLAKNLGVKLNTLEKWEDDMSEPRANKLSMMAGILNVSMVWLITGEGEGVGNPEDETPLSADLSEILSEMRTLRMQIKARTDKLGQLEKRLRQALKESAL